MDNGSRRGGMLVAHIMRRSRNLRIGILSAKGIEPLEEKKLEKKKRRRRAA
ncbi:Hypothetical protein SMAX5B_021381 [Scophthalmus maximus]|uniref:Uncharacterized protein n=1 Tax=Scophthalmus maximus TaxID=52904 RepID=A0A2U9B1K3_SCOMX|nr:Hypothetical protein SMAX5B_021381 [Scophthalmus maximus]